MHHAACSILAAKAVLQDNSLLSDSRPACAHLIKRSLLTGLAALAPLPLLGICEADQQYIPARG